MHNIDDDDDGAFKFGAHRHVVAQIGSSRRRAVSMRETHTTKRTALGEMARSCRAETQSNITLMERKQFNNNHLLPQIFCHFEFKMKTERNENSFVCFARVFSIINHRRRKKNSEDSLLAEYAIC